MSYCFTIDNREHKLITLFQKIQLPIEVKALDIGDIIIKASETCKKSYQDKDQRYESVFIFERKSMSDMISSIKDGRYKEQKARLQSMMLNRKTHKIFYLLEGDTQSLSEKEKKLIYGSWISTQFRDGIEIIRTISTLETIHFLCRLLDRLNKNGHQSLIPKNVAISNLNQAESISESNIENKSESNSSAQTASIQPNDKTNIKSIQLASNKLSDESRMSNNEKNIKVTKLSNDVSLNIEDTGNGILGNGALDNEILGNEIDIDMEKNRMEKAKSVELNYICSLKAKKKQNFTPKVCQILALGNVPSVSNKTAEGVINHFGSLYNLFIAYQEIDMLTDESLKPEFEEWSQKELKKATRAAKKKSNAIDDYLISTDNKTLAEYRTFKKERLLSDVVVGSDRKLGNNASRSIYCHLFCNNDES
jgi:ERCC4-type nuclease